METAIEKTENTALDKVITESGLVLTEAEEIKQSYLPFFNQLAEIKEEAKKINFENPSMLDEKIARDLRLRTVKVRTGSEEVKDNRKKIHMLKANVEQSSWNLIKSTCQLDEEKFAQVEKARERAEAARKAALKIERENELLPYDVDVEFVDLANMPEESYVKFLESAKVAQAQRVEAERIAEEERQAKEKEEAEEKERIRAENEKLKKEAEDREKAMVAERAKAAAAQKAIQEKADKEKAEAEAKAREEKAKQDAILKKEKEAREKLEAELKAKEDAEEEAEKQKQKAIKENELAKAKAAKAPKKQKLNTWIDGFVLGTPIGMDEDKTVVEISQKFEAFKKWAKTQIENI